MLLNFRPGLNKALKSVQNQTLKLLELPLMSELLLWQPSVDGCLGPACLIGGSGNQCSDYEILILPVKWIKRPIKV